MSSSLRCEESQHVNNLFEKIIIAIGYSPRAKFLVVLDIRLHCLWACGSIKSSATQTTSQCHHSLVYRQKWAWLSSNKSSLFSSCWERLRILSPCSFPWLHFSMMVVCRRLPSLVMCMVTCPLWLTEKRRDDASPKSSALPSPPTRQAPTPCAQECCRVSSLKHGLKNRVWFEVEFRTTRAPLESNTFSKSTRSLRNLLDCSRHPQVPSSGTHASTVEFSAHGSPGQTHLDCNSNTYCPTGSSLTKESFAFLCSMLWLQTRTTPVWRIGPL